MKGNRERIAVPYRKCGTSRHTGARGGGPPVRRALIRAGKAGNTVKPEIDTQGESGANRRWQQARCGPPFPSAVHGIPHRFQCPTDPRTRSLSVQPGQEE